MNEKILMRGNHAVGEAAIRARCRFYAGYPITPQNELTEYMAEAMSNLEDGTFIQAESEIAAINMVIGASITSDRCTWLLCLEVVRYILPDRLCDTLLHR